MVYDLGFGALGMPCTVLSSYPVHPYLDAPTSGTVFRV